MKSNIIGILVIIGISACTDVNFMMEEQIDKDYKRESRINDVANSELLDNWEQVEYITLRDGNVVVSPWKPFASTTFGAAFALDIKKKMVGKCCFIL